MLRRISVFVVMLITLLLFGQVFAAIPSISSSRYIKTFNLSGRNDTLVYTNRSLNQRGTSYPYKAYNALIYGNDEIYVYEMNSVYALVSYPTSSGRKQGYVRTSSLTYNNFSLNPLKSRNKIYTYIRPGSGSYGSIFNGDSVWPMARLGNYTQIIYPTGNTYKMAWITNSDYNNYIAPARPLPQTTPVPVPTPLSNITTLLKGGITRTNVSAKTNGYYCDYVASEGTPVYAPSAGTVQYKQSYAVNYGKLASYGNHIVFKSSDGIYEVKCAHFSKFIDGISMKYNSSMSYPCSWGNADRPELGKYKCKTITLATINVKQGDLIGYTGASGNAHGAHVHIEVYKNGVPVDPKSVF